MRNWFQFLKAVSSYKCTVTRKLVAWYQCIYATSWMVWMVGSIICDFVLHVSPSHVPLFEVEL